MSLKSGQSAPAFTLPDSFNRHHSLTDYVGSWLILFFYPKDNTPGCTVEACNFRDRYPEIVIEHTQIIGINTDKSESHQKFIDKYQLPFTLLSDLDGKISAKYGALFKLGPIKFSKRQSYIIDPEGKIVKIYRKVTPSKHVTQVINDLKTLKSQQIQQ